ncbi:MAG: BACON domain-containing protein, partial [Bacteroidales bacterium]
MRNVIQCLVMIFCISLFSCQTEEVKESSKFVIPDRYLSFDFTKEKTSGIIKIETNIETSEWSVSSDKEWCLVSKSGSSEIQLLVLENQERDVREAMISVKSSVENYEIKVKQLGYGPAILLSKSEFNLPNNEQEITLTVTSNIEYEIKIDESNKWISPIVTKAMVDTDHQFAVLANDKYSDRKDTIIVHEKGNPDVKAVCLIYQKSKDGNMDDIILEGDISIIPTGGKASENQPGQGIDKCFDGIMGQNNGFYHSVWSQSAKFPVVLEFDFEGTQSIDYLVYHTRSG